MAISICSYCRSLVWLLLTASQQTYAAPAEASTDPHFPSLHSRQALLSGPPSAAKFINRGYHASVHLGDYLYIDGGEIDFYGTDGKVHSLPDNNTYSIDVTQSWTNSSVVLNTIPKSAPVLNYGTLWADRGSSPAIYAFGGEQSFALIPAQSPSVPATSLWKFIPNKEQGQWSQVTTSQNFTGIVRPGSGIGMQVPDAGLLLGGLQSDRTSSESKVKSGFVPVPGILKFNITTQTWSNHSATGFSQLGTAQHGQGHLLMGLGANNLVAAFGGTTSNLISWTDNASNLLAFDTIRIYDPVNDRWFSQSTSGTAPQPRDRFCSVGVQGDNGTYEIFIYGGHVASSDGTEPQASASQAQKTINLAMDEVFVLSFPGFNWQQATYTPKWPRIDHTCNIIGNRQMVVIGGLNPTVNNLAELKNTTDIWTNGIGIFDLTQMQWSNQYQANADNYVTPQVVKTWYARNGMYPKKWDDANLAAYFVQQANTNPSSSSGTASPTTSSGSSTASSTSGSSKSSSTPVGSIVGGVIGGIAAIVLLGVLGWWLLRRRKQPTRQDESHPLRSYNSASKGDLVAHDQMVSEIQDSEHRPELQGDDGMQESTLHKHEKEAVEMSTQPKRYEMAG